MARITEQDLHNFLEKHLKWLRDEEGGERANLYGADLYGADLRGANLYGANLYGANLRGADLYGFIVELFIPSDAKRSSATSRKCRCSRAKVVSITTLNGEKTDLKSIASGWDSKFIYKVGKYVSVDNFDENRWNECAPGIHFFITRQEAVNY